MQVCWCLVLHLGRLTETRRRLILVTDMYNVYSQVYMCYLLSQIILRGNAPQVTYATSNQPSVNCELATSQCVVMQVGDFALRTTFVDGNEFVFSVSDNTERKS
jgi:hypothetical protein